MTIQKMIDEAWAAFEAWTRQHDPDGRMSTYEQAQSYGRWCDTRAASSEKMMANDDSDETEGRRLYRARADVLARSQVAMGKRRFKIAEDQEATNDDPGRPVPKHGSGP